MSRLIRTSILSVRLSVNYPIGIRQKIEDRIGHGAGCRSNGNLQDGGDLHLGRILWRVSRRIRTSALEIREILLARTDPPVHHQGLGIMIITHVRPIMQAISLDNARTNLIESNRIVSSRPDLGPTAAAHFLGG